MATVELTNIDDRLYEALVTRAAKDNRSVSEEVETILRESLFLPKHDPWAATEAMLKLVGSWQDERTAEEIIADIRASRRSGRRFNVDPSVFD